MNEQDLYSIVARYRVIAAIAFIFPGAIAWLIVSGIFLFTRLGTAGGASVVSDKGRFHMAGIDITLGVLLYAFIYETVRKKS